MRITNTLSLALAIALLPINLALGADSPVYKDGLLTIPSANTAGQVGKYQDVTFKLTEQGTWQLLSGKDLGAVGTGVPAIGFVLIEKVDVVKTDSFPTQVFLRVSGGFSPCNNAILGQINQRLENNRFDIAITVNFLVPSPPVTCAAVFMPLVRTIPLPVYGLPAGIYSYSVDAGGLARRITGTFELTADNKYPGDY